jgi:hypothetical protein
MESIDHRSKAWSRERVTAWEQVVADLTPQIAHQARAEVAMIQHLLAERERLALAAIRVSPPPLHHR